MYSWADHYEPLRRSLGAVRDRLVEEGWKARVLVDDNALVDRAAAVRAGIGWFGKSSNVLVPGAGSWFLLGSVLTDAPLDDFGGETAVGDGCGSCRRCIVACPTGAIVGPGVVDARRCLAWLLQAPGVFPREHREALGDRIYGCDDCQEVCPVNVRFARTAQRDGPDSVQGSAAIAGSATPQRAHTRDLAPGSQARVDLLELLASDDEAILRSLGRWYIPGREARYVRRNALIALGNCADPGDAEVASALASALADTDPVVRSHAVWSTARLGLSHLLEHLSDDPHPLVAAELAELPEARAARN